MNAIFVKNQKGLLMRKGQGYINAYDFLDQHFLKVRNKTVNSKTAEMDIMNKQKTCNSIQNMS